MYHSLLTSHHYILIKFEFENLIKANFKINMKKKTWEKKQNPKIKY